MIRFCLWIQLTLSVSISFCQRDSKVNCYSSLTIINTSLSKFHIEYYDSLLNSFNVAETERKEQDFRIAQNNFSAIGGFVFGEKSSSSFGVLTIPGDSIQVIIDSQKRIKCQILENNNLNKKKNEEQSLEGVIDEPYLSLLDHKKEMTDQREVALYNEGFKSRKRTLYKLYNDFQSSDYFKMRILFLELDRRNTIFRLRLARTILNENECQKYMKDSILSFVRDNELEYLPNTYNFIGQLLQLLTKQYPKKFTNEYCFSLIAEYIHYKPLMQKLVLYYLKREKHQELFNSMARITLQKLPDSVLENTINKYRLLKFESLQDNHNSYFVDNIGNHLKLDSLIGANKAKIILFDFWASWCAPCLASIPSTIQLSKKYDQDLIVFYLSIDNSIEAWKAKSDNFHFSNKTSFILPTFSFVYKKLKFIIKGIPRGILIDKKGDIIDENTPSSESKDLDLLIRNNL